MDLVNDLLEGAGSLVAAVVALAVVVLGFSMARRFLTKVDSGPVETAAERWQRFREMRADGWSPYEIDKGGKWMGPGRRYEWRKDTSEEN